MSLSHRYRLLLLGAVALMLTGGGCTRDQKTGKGAVDVRRLDPTEWDYAEAGYTLRKKLQFKVGDWWVIKPPHELNPIGLEVFRSLSPLEVAPPEADAPAPAPESAAADEAAPPAGSAAQGDRTDVQVAASNRQRLSLDITNGRGFLVDFDGRAIPLELDNQTLTALRELVKNRYWLHETIDPAKTALTPTYYRVVALDRDPRLHEQAFWAIPPDPRDPMPELFLMLTRIFDKANRLAHPLSERIDLLK
jgi:hypothetical protein